MSTTSVVLIVLFAVSVSAHNNEWKKTDPPKYYDPVTEAPSYQAPASDYSTPAPTYAAPSKGATPAPTPSYATRPPLPTGRCGPYFGWASCAGVNECCSKYGWCGTTVSHCDWSNATEAFKPYEYPSDARGASQTAAPYPYPTPAPTTVTTTPSPTTRANATTAPANSTTTRTPVPPPASVGADASGAGVARSVAADESASFDTRVSRLIAVAIAVAAAFLLN